jgi:hypothetical protein
VIALKIPPKSQALWLPMLFFLPTEYINPCPTLRKIPRNLLEIAHNPEMIAIVNSEQFINEVADAIAALVFPHFGFRGWKEDYSGYSPLWKLSYALPLWAKKIEKITGWGLSALLNEPEELEIPWFPYDYVKEVMANVVDQVIFEQEWRPILDVIREMPCEEDYEPRISRVRIDWRRKWYHTRAKLKSESLDALIQDPNSGILWLSDDNKVSMEEQVASRDYIWRFKKWLKPKDRQILKLRTAGYTYKEIAKMLGYTNHSGVIKRIQFIGDAYREYDEKNNQDLLKI